MKYPRPRFHLTAHKGWMNDPNGFSKAFGEYHLFGQSNPEEVAFGLMRWAHYVSKDLLNWDYVGEGIFPDGPHETPHGCFSGTCLPDGDALYAYYTGASEGRQVQCVAKSLDGRTFEKSKKNPILDANDLPEGYLPDDFRDPKIIEKDGRYYLLVAAKKEGGASILLYEGTDHEHFVFKSSIREIEDVGGTMFECPDFAFLDKESGKGILVYSVQFLEDGVKDFQNVHSTCYEIGILDLGKGIFEPISPRREIDHGFDFYAAELLEDDARILMVAWEGMWDRNYPTAVDGYAGNFILIRELREEDGRLVQSFARELEKATSPVDVPETIDCSSSCVVDSLEGERVRLRFRCAFEEGSSFTLLSNEEGSGLKVGFHPERGCLLIERKGMEEEILHLGKTPVDAHCLPLEENQTELDFDIVIDGIAVDILVNGGRSSFSSLYFAKEGKTTFRLSGDIHLKNVRKDIFQEVKR